MNGKLYLIPTFISSQNPDEVLPVHIITIINSLEIFISEDIRTTRRFLSSLHISKPIRELTFYELNEHSTPEQVEYILQFLLDGKNAGIISEAGVPAVADPGASLVALAHKHDIQVIPLVGPSSILLALMASGMNGQRFCFNGYLPVKQSERKTHIKHLEKRSDVEKQTEVFMETPYRNQQLLEDILRYCKHTTRLCIAADITGAGENIKTRSIAEWKNAVPQINKIPVIFLLES